MRIVLALWSMAAFAQQSTRIEDYLGLTEEQIEKVAENSASFNEAMWPVRMRQYELEPEIQREMSAEPLNPAALDALHVENEMLKRRYDAGRRKFIADNVALLTAAQRQKYTAYTDAVKLTGLIQDARFIGLLSDGCVHWPTRPDEPLAAYLQLTQEQTAAIVERQRSAAFANAGAQKRLFDLHGEFNKAMSAEPLDSLPVGAAAASRLMAGRELRILYQKLPAENRIALNGQQRQLLDILAAAEKLAGGMYDGYGAFLDQFPWGYVDTSKLLASLQCEFQYSSYLR